MTKGGKSKQEVKKENNKYEKKKGSVTAADIIVCDGVEVKNPDHHIATIAKGGKMKMELRVRRGHGYVSSVKNKEFIKSVGEIAIDSIYTPISRVAYSTEKVRVGEVAHEIVHITIFSSSRRSISSGSSQIRSS